MTTNKTLLPGDTVEVSDNSPDPSELELDFKVYAENPRHSATTFSFETNWFQSVFEHSPVGMVVSDTSGKFLHVNRSFYDMLGYSQEEIFSPEVIVSAPDAIKKNTYARSMVTQPETGAIATEKNYRHKNGQLVRALMHVTPLRDSDGKTIMMFNQVIDLTELHEAKDTAIELANTDSLTTLPNRRGFIDHLEQLIGKWNKENSLALLIVDINKFKTINDTLGHEMGDAVLMKCAKRIARSAGKYAFAARMGGDEFAIIVPFKNKNILQKLSARIASALSKPLVIDKHHLTVSASIGVAQFPDDAKSGKDLIRRADLAMLYGKSRSEPVYNFLPELEAVSKSWRMFSHSEKFTYEKSFSFATQKIIDLSDGTALFNEVLTRIKWNKKLLTPDWFIPLAELTGTIVQLDKYIIKLIFEKINRGTLETPLSINVSAITFCDRLFASLIKNLMTEYSIDPETIILELTESAALTNAKFAQDNALSLSETGIRIALDDWGTGNTSFAAMRQLHYDILKIDRELIAEIGSSTLDENLIRHIIALGKESNFLVIAEGVESVEQLQWLKSEECSYVQGFYIDTPNTTSS